MELQFDRQINISVGSNRKALHWNPQTLSISELWERLKIPAKGTETQADYFALKKNQQDELKDVGGFVGGTLNGERRKASAVTGRDLITLDFDTIKPYGTDGVIAAVENIGVAYCIYSTRKHMETSPRLRIIFPLDLRLRAKQSCFKGLCRFYEGGVSRWQAERATSLCQRNLSMTCFPLRRNGTKRSWRRFTIFPLS